MKTGKQENNAKTNPGKDVSGKNGTYGHPKLTYIIKCCTETNNVKNITLGKVDNQIW